VHLFAQAHGLGAVAGFAGQFQVIVDGQKRAQAAAHNGMVVHQQDADRFGFEHERIPS
jgi:hypothetical protein